ncbi:MAG: DUF541 domain-containing protein [Actinobacteria bacterium]|nr:MAG: DUF541 domain-containing protein [Actinomycetota bacterium]
MEDQVIVRGESQGRSMPDTAVVRATVNGEGTSRDEAYGKAATDAKAVDVVLDNYREGLERVGHAALVVHPKSKWKKGEAVRTGWVASRTTLVEIADVQRLGDLIAELATAGADLTGPSWQLDPKNPVHSMARRAAAEDARRRADDYAEALGLVVREIVWVAEPGLRGATDSGPRYVAVAAAAAPMRAPAGEDVMDISPYEMTVAAAIEVGFRLERPGS